MTDVEPTPLVALDVGGTTLAAAVVAGDVLVTPPVRGPSHQVADLEIILDAFAAAINQAVSGRRVGGAAVAMPGPFDYAAGVSQMRHKFAALFGVDLGERLREATRLATVFVNDAQAAAAGTWVELGRPDAPVATITLGTGVGSGLIVDGDPAGHNEIWCATYGDGIVEDHVSSRALSDMFERRTGLSLTVAEIAGLADDGHDGAIADFAEYGRHLGAATAAYFADAGPATVSVAGGVTGAWQHIEPSATAAYHSAGGTGTLVRSRRREPALVGAAELGRRILQADDRI